MMTRYPIIFLLCAALLAGCGAARPSKYYQLTVPGNDSADPPGDAFPVTIVMGPLMSSHLYREDRIVYSSNDEAVSGKDVSAVVAALDHNVHRATNEFTGSLAGYFSAHPPASPVSPAQ